MDKRLIKLLSTRSWEIRGGQMLDTYNQQIHNFVSCTIRTNINTANHHFIVMEEPQVMTPKRTEFGKQVRKDYESGNLSISRHDMTTMVSRTDGVSNTLTSVQKDNYLCIPEATKSCQQGVVTNYRIRKLTPRECFRLMGVDDKDIDKIQLYPFGEDIQYPSYSYKERLANMTEEEKRKLMRQGISNSQQYKMAGNSIVVDNLYHIFRTLFVDKPTKQVKQLTLF